MMFHVYNQKNKGYFAEFSASRQTCLPAGRHRGCLPAIALAQARRAGTAGFTLLELLIVIALITVVVTTGVLFLGNINYGSRLENTTNELVTLLRTSQQLATNQEQGSRWGVFVDNPNAAQASYDLFSVNDAQLANLLFTGMPGVSKQHVLVPSGINLIDPAPGENTRIIFGRTTGLPLATETIVLETMVGAISKTISIEANGRINTQ